MPETNRRSANYHPSIWGDHILTYASDHEFLVNLKNIIVSLIVRVRPIMHARMFKLEIYFVVLFSNFHIIIFIHQFAHTCRKLIMRK
jgi:hypothetical protein